jgi:hypothetical protein
LRSVLTAMVFFDYDQSTIRDDSKSTLDQKVLLLRANPVALRIEVMPTNAARSNTTSRCRCAERTRSGLPHQLWTRWLALRSRGHGESGRSSRAPVRPLTRAIVVASSTLPAAETTWSAEGRP